jgi:hypothetical protein
MAMAGHHFTHDQIMCLKKLATLQLPSGALVELLGDITS